MAQKDYEAFTRDSEASTLTHRTEPLNEPSVEISKAEEVV